MKLYEISQQYESIIDNAINPETGEINENEMMRLDEIKLDAKEKGIAVASYIKNLIAEQHAIKEARVAMCEREKRIEREVDWLSDYLRTNMERCGIKEISCPHFVIKLRKNPVSVNITDENMLPREYIREKITTSIDKVGIRESILAGAVIPGAELIQNTSVTIR